MNQKRFGWSDAAEPADGGGLGLDFFLRVSDVQLTFAKGEAGKITHLVLHQNGVNQKAVRVE